MQTPNQTLPKKLLLIEDDGQTRQLYKDVLVDAQFQVDDFASGKKGLEAALNPNNQYDLVLLDIMLPDTNGLDILKNIRNDPLKKNTRIVMMTNLGQEDVIEQAYFLKANGYMVKVAYNPDQIIEQVKKYLNSET